MRVAVMMLGGKRGGIEQAAVDHCRALRHAGHEVTAVVRTHAAIIPALQAAWIPFVSLRAPHRWNLWTRRQLQHLLPRYDCVVLHGNRAGAVTRGLRALPPVIAVAHSRFFKPQPQMSLVVALTDARAEALRPQLACPVTVIANLVDLPPEPQRAPPRQPPVIGTMGRFSHEKGFDLLLDALALLRLQGITFRARIGGDGAAAPALKAQAAQLGLDDAIEWCGWVADKSAFFASIDLFVLPSRTESFPLTVLEAMAHGCPIVATDCGGPSAMLTPECGILTPTTAEAIARGLAQALTTADLAAMGNAARTRASEQYALPVIAARWDETLRACSKVGNASI